MKLPGRAWLEFEVHPDGNGALLRQMATFDPFGLWGAGLLVWRVAVAPNRVRRDAARPCACRRQKGMNILLQVSARSAVDPLY
jgi:hypothetical protein